jgi:hypothetical protein
MGGMSEDTWLKMEREYFVESKAEELEVLPKKLNKILEYYNKFLQRALFGESPFVAEDLRRTIVKANEDVDNTECVCDKRTPDGIVLGGFCMTDEDKRKSKGTYQRCMNCGGRLYTA